MQNGTILQFFHWYYPVDGSLWTRLKDEAPRLANMGFTAIWLPPGTVRTKYGTRQQLLDSIKAIHDAGMQVYVDIVLNHKATKSLFDASLHHFDLTTIFNDTLVVARPELAVTMVDNHDTQPLQSLEAPIDPWFKPLAYAIVLLREHGYPCVFYPDLYSTKYKDKGHDGKDYEIDLPAVDLDHPNCIGWTREGDDEHRNSGCAVIISNGDEASKTMAVGKRHAGTTFTDHLGKHPAKVIIDRDGKGEFRSNGGSVSVWAAEDH